MTKEDDILVLLIKVFDNEQTLITNADSKANIAFSIQTFIMTTVLGTAIIVDAFNKFVDLNCWIKLTYYVLFAAFLISSIIGLIICIHVFKPRPPLEENEINRKGIIYFGHIKKFKNSSEYLEKINETKSNDLIKDFAFQNYNLAIILDYKMKFLKYSTTFLFVNILLGIILFIFSLITK